MATGTFLPRRPWPRRGFAAGPSTSVPEHVVHYWLDLLQRDLLAVVKTVFAVWKLGFLSVCWGLFLGLLDGVTILWVWTSLASSTRPSDTRPDTPNDTTPCARAVAPLTTTAPRAAAQLFRRTTTEVSTIGVMRYHGMFLYQPYDVSDCPFVFVECASAALRTQMRRRCTCTRLSACLDTRCGCESGVGLTAGPRAAEACRRRRCYATPATYPPRRRGAAVACVRSELISQPARVSLCPFGYNSRSCDVMP